MSYKLEKRNPYNKKSISFIKKTFSSVIFALTMGTIVISSSRLHNMYLITEASENYSSAIVCYEDIIDTTADFFIENEVDSPEACFELYTKLLWNGYFSNGMKYEYNITDRNNVNGNYGIRIATGEGDCKNNEDFFCKLLKKLGYDAFQMACMQVSDKEIFPNLDDALFGNHVVTVVIYEGKIYYFDVTNYCTYEKVGEYMAENKEKHLRIVLKPVFSYMYGYTDGLETYELLVPSEEYDSTNAIVVDDNLKKVMKNSKILMLRKALEPSLQEICKLIKE